MGNPDLQLRTDSLGLTPLLAPLSPLLPVKVTPQHGLLSKTLLSSGGSGSGLPTMAVEVAAFDCSSSNESVSSMTGRHDSKLIGKHSILHTLSARQTSSYEDTQVFGLQSLPTVLPTARESRCNNSVGRSADEARKGL